MFQNLVTRIKSNVAVTAIVASGLTGVAGVSAYTLTRPIKATTDNTVNQEQVAKDKQDQAKKDDSQDKKIDETSNQLAQNSSQIAQLQTQTSSISSSVSTIVEKVVVIEKQVASSSSSSSVAGSTPSTVIPTPVTPTPVTPPASSSSSAISYLNDPDYTTVRDKILSFKNVQKKFTDTENKFKFTADLIRGWVVYEISYNIPKKQWKIDSAIGVLFFAPTENTSENMLKLLNCKTSEELIKTGKEIRKTVMPS